ncbi:MAG: MFS transporter, partial [Thermoleophilaceae bacterium]
MPSPEGGAEATAASAREPAASALSPLRIPVFRAVWTASLASYVGTWMHLVAVGWLMTTLTSSVTLIALVQTAIALPTLVLALPGGALADMVDRRRMIIATQAWQVVTAATLGIVTLTDVATPGLVLALTLALGVGAALGLPVFWAVVPEIVGRAELPAALALNSAGITLAQAVGPALGGLLVASAGAGVVFLLNAGSFLVVVAVITAWRRTPSVSALPREHVVEAVRAGLRYVRNAPPLQVVLLRTAAHAFCYSVLPALLVVVARTRLDVGAAGYGVLFGCFGAGGAIGAVLLTRVRAHISTDRLMVLAGATLAAALVALGTLRSFAALLPVMVLGGAGSVMVMSSLNIAVQSVLPDWVRGRGLALQLLTFQAALAAGAACWGAMAANVSVSAALIAAAAAMVAAHMVSALAGLRLAIADDVDLAPASWLEPQFVLEPDPRDGPILIEIEYRIALEQTPEFLEAMRQLRRTRRRDGAVQWSIYQDLSDPERHVESFLVRSWAEHERAHERAVQSDRAVIERVLALHHGEAPRVTHLLWHDLR